ncbi:MAG: phospho-N-acetylmuramoyl-pentapeptide-transferase [Crocinitomicaceae bacterium]|jgi:phospho-N-acetylmuramoyl-pentapeptide-transferase|nr:phospho-N-acetylmuramoyl-pentapeptide-transferase [Crocinitomicaceae bacterium]MBT6514746.1 phospho-N-acetylmuramoyl-pentapeptide-transferase [Crocinitomicaceae bacterium]
MFYHLFTYLQEQGYDFPGIGLFDYISFRSAMAIVTSLLISMVFGKRLIRLLHRKQVGELVRDLGLEGQKEKEGTPTMGGLIILGAIIIPTLLFAKIDNIYTITMLLATVWLGLIGFLDDYIKVFRKNKKGLAGKFKIVGQIGVGIIVGSLLYFHSDVTIKERIQPSQFDTEIASVHSGTPISGESTVRYGEEVKSRSTTIPFIKNNEFNYEWLLPKSLKDYTWIVFILMTIIIVTAVSNGANMTDGLDGLATGTSAIIGITLAIFAYVSGNAIFADYLNIMYIPNSGELVIFISSFIGACVGFLWYNSYPAKVFMGDTGSLAIGGIIATFAIAIRKELIIPIFCGIFLIENLSVMIQVAYFKYTKKRSPTGEGKRVFRMAPLHHHYQKKGMHEAKIVARFWIIGVLLAILSIVTLKLR